MESYLQSLGKLPGDTNAQSGLRITAIETYVLVTLRLNTRKWSLGGNLTHFIFFSPENKIKQSRVFFYSHSRLNLEIIVPYRK